MKFALREKRLQNVLHNTDNVGQSILRGYGRHMTSTLLTTFLQHSDTPLSLLLASYDAAKVLLLRLFKTPKQAFVLYVFGEMTQ